MSENTLKKEFNKADVQRIRNIVNKDYTSKTKSQTGYKRSSKRYKEGDIWEESGKQWTIKNGIKQNITKLDSAKKAAQIPLACPKCNGTMNYYLSKQTYKINKMCFNCTMDYTDELRKAGLLDDYIRQKQKGNIKVFVNDVEQQLQEYMDDKMSIVSEQGDVEVWKSNSSKNKAEMSDKLKEYLEYLKSKLD
tara:strand:+ start:410 stop:985 length:576 start_codon:yes stop_codon:yes gene_type:complete